MIKKTILFLGIILIVIAKLSCCSSEEIKKEDNVAADSIKYMKLVPPNTADIKAEVVDYSEGKDNFICKLRVVEVFTYGASFPPLPPGTETSAYISKSLIKKELKGIEIGTEILVRLSHLIAPGDKEYWEIIRFNE